MNLRASFGSVKLTVKIRAFEVQSGREGGQFIFQCDICVSYFPPEG